MGKLLQIYSAPYLPMRNKYSAKLSTFLSASTTIIYPLANLSTQSGPALRPIPSRTGPQIHYALARHTQAGPHPTPILKMARNSEKAQSMLFRFRAFQASSLGILDTSRTRRPKAISTIDQISVCERWRGQVLKEISRKVSKIQDPALSDYQIRDLNDELNGLFKEKWQWELRIRELGGPNYMRGGGRVTDEEGRTIEGGGKGYRYFGRARELPGVKELFEGGKREEKEEGRGQVKRVRVDAGYFGYGDEEGGLVEEEARKEEDARRVMAERAEEEDAEWEPLPGDPGDGVEWRVPDVQEVEQELLERRRRRLLDNLG
ncbi:pre-mRNA-splicing factor isy1 [Elsinoe australis]|uniref:Pre-mRNA-splicing factor isy1 n=1 Tax=Elsinoe australis TaxID=40998 RepID=A0A4U7AN44_9PEZI|nr:pre-mRNA-splicing factor isy1 [Elsinoe australis]